MRKSLAVFLSGVALTIAASTALAGEQVLEFKLVTKPIDYKMTAAANIEGQWSGPANCSAWPSSRTAAMR